jgi:PIN domain nuclease of toxin-antitoxin system
MNGFLLDTHALIWYLEGNERIPNKTVQYIENADNTIIVSIASYWEIHIKVSLGKLKLPVSPVEFIRKAEAKQISTLPIAYRHLDDLLTLPFHHKDPFDRLIIAVARTEKLPIITVDKQFQPYDVAVFWD